MTVLSRVLLEKRALIIPLVLGIAASVLLYALVVFPLGRQVASAETEAHAAHELVAKARLDNKSARATIAGKQQADAALQKFYADVLPRDQSEARRLTYTQLSELARTANVRLEHGVNAVEPEKNSTLSKLTSTYTLTGDYRDVRRFIYALETAPQFLILENVGLTSDTSQQTKVGLSMSLQISTYFRTGNAAN